MVYDLCKQILGIFETFLKKVDYLAMITGSYCRESDRDFSDIDFVLIYDNEKTIDFVVFEELVCLAFSKILNIKRDKIHSIFCYIIEKTQGTNIRYEKERKFKIIWKNNQKEKYVCRNNTEYDMFLFRTGPRDYKTFLNYIEMCMKESCFSEWLYNYKVIVNKTKYHPLLDIAKLEEKLNKGNINPIPFFCEQKIEIKKRSTSKQLKDALKYNFLEDFYKFMSFIRYLIFINKNTTTKLDMSTFFNNEEVEKIIGKEDQKKLENIFYEYMWSLTRLEYVLKDFNKELSNHCLRIINTNKISNCLKKKYGENLDVFEELTEKNVIVKKIFNKKLREIYEQYHLH